MKAVAWSGRLLGTASRSLGVPSWYAVRMVRVLTGSAVTLRAQRSHASGEFGDLEFQHYPVRLALASSMVNAWLSRPMSPHKYWRPGWGYNYSSRRAGAHGLAQHGAGAVAPRMRRP